MTPVTRQLEIFDQSFIWGPTLQRPMRAMIIVVVLPFTQFVVEQMDVVRDAVSIQQLIELLHVDAV
jgi:hypothetical protein